MATTKQKAVARAKFQAMLDPPNAPSDVQIVKKAYGYAQNSAEKHAYEIVESRGVQKTLQELIDKKMPDSLLASKGKQLFNFKNPIRDKSGKVIAREPDGEIQFKTWTTLLKMKGALKDSGDTNIDARSVNINLEPADIERLANVTARIEALNKNIEGV